MALSRNAKTVLVVARRARRGRRGARVPALQAVRRRGPAPLRDLPPLLARVRALARRHAQERRLPALPPLDARARASRCSARSSRARSRRGSTREVEVGACASCHFSHDPRWPQVGGSRGHRIHYEEKKIACVRCHAASMHGFEPVALEVPGVPRRARGEGREDARAALLRLPRVPHERARAAPDAARLPALPHAPGDPRADERPRRARWRCPAPPATGRTRRTARRSPPAPSATRRRRWRRAASTRRPGHRPLPRLPRAARLDAGEGRLPRAATPAPRRTRTARPAPSATRSGGAPRPPLPVSAW